MSKLTKFALVASLVLLCSCGSTKIETKDRLTIIEPPAALYECPPLPALPVGMIKDTDNAILIARLANVGLSCHASLDAIKQNIAEQKKIILAHPVATTTTTP